MAISGCVEGYLIKLEQEYGSTVYCILEEGILQYYKGKGGGLIGETQLTGSKITVNLIRDVDAELPNRFVVTCKKRLERKNVPNGPGPVEFDNTEKLCFAASTPEIQEEWATAILNWNKHCWDDSESVFSYKDELVALQRLLKSHNICEKPSDEAAIHPIR